MTADDRLLSGASSESSLPPNKSSGDIGELKPCPFCGPGNSIVECYQDDYGGWKVGCGRCGSHSGFRPKSDPDARAKVIANWNKRPAESAAEIERLRRENQNLKQDLKDRLDAWTLAMHGKLNAEAAVAAAWEACRTIIEEECYLDVQPVGMTRRAIHRVGLAIRDRINCAERQPKGNKS